MTTTPQGNSEYIGTYTGVTASTTYTDYNWSKYVGPQGSDGPQGPVGDSGFNQAVIYLYKRGTTAPTLGTISFTYTFSTASISSATLNGWTSIVPSGTDPLYVTVASVASQSASITVTNTVFSSPSLLAESGATGATGADGAAGLNVATVYIYKRANTAPVDKPTGNTTYTFATGDISFTTANGWLSTPPSTGGDNLYVRLATASANTSTDIIGDTE